MTIQVLSTRLANQIAAGEVVERPASVVKELVENSIDAGASRIEIDIEKGGSKCIRIQDNGKGVCHEQLTLALSRHATSKISNLDDLDAIESLGFRGEALASISSVCRLTFASKPRFQAQAWQAISEGRDMQVNLQPVAHPDGTTVEVLDLFFNTPARRRFLKTEKTEFQHIDELIRRIALSSFHITFVLKHNDKIIRQYRAGKTEAQNTKRLASICSENFVRSAIYFKNEENELKISGWVSNRFSPRALCDVQYCYINGRMIKDKLVTHAIKQAYAYLLPEGKFPGFVIYITCPPAEVDVNVHPAKHEVRFHQARRVHDFIVSTLLVTLNEGDLTDENNITTDNRAEIQNPATAHDYQLRPKPEHLVSNHTPDAFFSSAYGVAKKTTLDTARVEAYCDVAAQGVASIDDMKRGHSAQSVLAKISYSALGDIVCLFEDRYLLLRLNPEQKMITTIASMMVLSLHEMHKTLNELQLVSAYQDGEIIAQPLLLPVRVELNIAQQKVFRQFESIFLRLGFVFKTHGNKLIVNRVPSLLREQHVPPIANIIVKLIAYLSTQGIEENQFEISPFCRLLSCLALPEHVKTWDMSSAGALLNKAINCSSELLLSKNIFIEAQLSLLVKGFENA